MVDRTLHGFEPVLVHPARVLAEQPPELARMWSQHARRGPVGCLELVEGVRIDDCR